MHVGCCGSCPNGASGRPRLVAGVFVDIDGARAVAEQLRLRDAGAVNVLTTLTPSSRVTATVSLARCSRLYQQISRHLEQGSAVVVVDTETREQQLGASRALLESKCDVLLTHDAGAYAE